jgi:hypothetical protein
MEIEGSWSQVSQRKSKTPFLKKQTKSKKTLGVTQVVEFLPNKHMALSPNSNTAKKSASV